MIRLLCVIVALLMSVRNAASQVFDLPIEGDVVAYTTAEADAIYLYDTTTNITRTLQFGAGDHHVWDFSPDGCQVLFTLTNGNDPTGLYSANLNGDDLRPLLTTDELGAGPWFIWEPDWNPTENRVAFTISRETEQGRESRVAWVEPGATPQVPSFYSVAGDEHTPRWSPDGNWLAYVSYEERAAGATIYATAEPNTEDNAPRVREADIWMVSADGLTKERITRFDVGSAASPRWSPDGQLLGFIYSPIPGENQFWMIAAAAEAIPTPLSFEWNQTLDATWHPDGKTMVASVRGFQGVNGARLWTIPIVGNADTDGTRFFDDPEFNNLVVDYPRFNAAGTHLAFRSNYNVSVMELATGELFALDGAGNMPPVWSPAGFAGEATCD
ncbi:MAG: hypothetical protein AAFR56_05275 [Chloroflexota bacterium]